MKRVAFVAWAALLVVSGCVHYQARPIDPASNLASIESRSLESPELAGFLTAHQPSEWPPKSWDLRALTLVALYYHPDLDVARRQWAEARAAVKTAGQRENPTAAVSAGYNSTTPTALVTPWILSLNLDFTIETAGKRRHRIDAAQRMSESAGLKVADAAWRVRSRVRTSLLALYAATGRSALLAEQHDLQVATLALIDRRFQAGELSSFEAAAARIATERSRLAKLDADRQGAEARARLAAALGLPLASIDGRAIALEGFDAPVLELPEPAVRRQALLSRPDVLAALSDYEATQAGLRLEVARQYPDIHLGPGYEMDQHENKWSLGLGGVIPMFHRNQGPIAEAEARRATAAAVFTSVQSRALEEIDLSLAAYRAARDKAEATAGLIGDLSKEETAAQSRFRAGDISRLDLNLIQLELAQAKLARFDANVQWNEAAGQVEDAMQTPSDLPAWVTGDREEVASGAAPPPGALP